MNDLIRFRLDHKETHLSILCDRNSKASALQELVKHYSLLERFIQTNPLFLSSYEPIEVSKDAPLTARNMADAAKKCGVGPMAAVAGAFSDIIGRFLLEKGAQEAIVENGGDIFMKISEPRIVGVHAGPSSFSDRIAFRILPEDAPVGICTSSDSVGPSISLGKPDASTVFADSAALADAAATAIGNLVKGEGGVENGIERAKTIPGVRGALIIRGEEMGVWGDVPELIKSNPNSRT